MLNHLLLTPGRSLILCFPFMGGPAVNFLFNFGSAKVRSQEIQGRKEIKEQACDSKIKSHETHCSLISSLLSFLWFIFRKMKTKEETGLMHSWLWPESRYWFYLCFWPALGIHCVSWVVILKTRLWDDILVPKWRYLWTKLKITAGTSFGSQVIISPFPDLWFLRKTDLQ